MNTKQLKKQLILNIPYIILGLLATNLGEAWRIAAGANASEKVQSLVLDGVFATAFSKKLSHAVFLGFSRLLCIARCLCSGVTRFSKGFHSRDQSRTRLLSAFLVRFLGAVRFLVCCLECHQCCFCSLAEGSVKIAFSFCGVRFQNAYFDQVPL